MPEQMSELMIASVGISLLIHCFRYIYIYVLLLRVRVSLVVCMCFSTQDPPHAWRSPGLDQK